MTKPRLFINGYGVADVAYDPVDSVSVAADGVKTNATLLSELFALIDKTKITRNSILHYGYFYSVTYSDATLILCSTVASVSYAKTDIIGMNINETNSLFRGWEIKTSGNTVSDMSSNVPTSGTKITFYY